MIFQDPFSSLNPRMTIAEIIGEPLLVNGIERRARAQRSGWPNCWNWCACRRAYLNRFPHAFSRRPAPAHRHRPGARAEPVAGRGGRAGLGAGRLGAGADRQPDAGAAGPAGPRLSVRRARPVVVKHVSHRVAVMYVGRIVEVAPTEALFATPRHPYTEALLSAVPVPDPRRRAQRIVLEGDVADPSDPPPGCPSIRAAAMRPSGAGQEAPALAGGGARATGCAACGRGAELGRCAVSAERNCPSSRQIKCNIRRTRFSAETMQLTMTVLRCPDSVAPETRSVSGGEFSVGRGPGVDWVLPDPERLLSKRHFAVAFRGGIWQLADTSTNGTFLNREGDADRRRRYPQPARWRSAACWVLTRSRCGWSEDARRAPRRRPAPARSPIRLRWIRSHQRRPERNPFDEPDHPSLRCAQLGAVAARLRPAGAGTARVAVPRPDPGGSFAGNGGCISAAAARWGRCRCIPAA